MQMTRDGSAPNGYTPRADALPTRYNLIWCVSESEAAALAAAAVFVDFPPKNEYNFLHKNRA